MGQRPRHSAIIVHKRKANLTVKCCGAADSLELIAGFREGEAGGRTRAYPDGQSTMRTPAARARSRYSDTFSCGLSNRRCPQAGMSINSAPSMTAMAAPELMAAR